jgi:hypothetical protein
MKRIIGTRLSAPEIIGYPDKARIIDESTGMVLLDLPRFGTNPNGINPHTSAPWQTCYAQMAPVRSVPFYCIKSKKYGKCIMLNSSGPIATTLPNHNPETKRPGTCTAYDVEIHCGHSAKPSPWNRGSKICQTVHPDDWEMFISHFVRGEKGIYELVDETPHA